MFPVAVKAKGFERVRLPLPHPMKLLFAASAPDGLETAIRFVTREERAQLSLPAPEAEFSAKRQSLLLVHASRTLYAGVGEAARVDGQTIRSAAGAAAKLLQAKGRTRIALALGSFARFAQEAAEGVLLGAYRFSDFKAPADAGGPSGLESVCLIASEAELASVRSAGERGQIFAEAANYARQLGNQPGNLFYPETLAQAAQSLADESGGALAVTVFDEAALASGGFGGISAVGAGSQHGPRLIVIRYQGGAAGDPPLALCGKSITFDSGGISIKPADRMEEMIWDKCGGCAVLGAMKGIAALKPARNIVAILASAENMTGPGAYRPGDVLTIYDGKRIEINNTDAEGRVVLADAISYARLEFKPSAILDLATLTGACGIALGDAAAGLWDTSEPLRQALLAAAGTSGERLWPMPLYPEYEDLIKSDIALIKNSSGRPAAACTAAAFLRTFAEDTPWAHIDLASPSAISKDRADLARGATGFGVRLLLEHVSPR